MNHIKRRLPQFSFYDRTGIERYLEKQAQKGWRLCKIKGPIWHFEEIEPQKIHFFVAYLPAASLYDPEPTDAQKQFVAFCEHTGWQQAAYNGEMQIFWHAGENPVPIETDAQMELQSIHRAMKKSFLPSMALLFFVGVMQMTMFIADWLKSPINVLTETSVLYRGLMALILIVMTSVEIGGYFLWRHRAIKAAADGSFIKTRGHHRLQWMMLLLALMLLIGTLMTLEHSSAALLTFSILYVVLIFALVQGVTAILKRKKVSGEVNKTLTIMAAAVLSVVMIGILPFLSLNAIFPDRTPENTQISAPLLPSDYFDVESVAYDIDLNKAHSPLLARSTYYISPVPIGRESPRTVYVIYDTKLDWAYDICLNQLLAEQSYRVINAQDFAAQAVYRQYWGDQPVVNGAYIVCYGDRIVLLRPGTELTGEQMRTIAEKLKP